MVEPKPTHRTMGIIQNADLCKQLSGWRVLFCRISPQTRLIDGYSWSWCFGVNTEASLLPLALGPDLLSKKKNRTFSPCLWHCGISTVTSTRKRLASQTGAESKQEVSHTLRGCPYSADQPRVSHAPGAVLTSPADQLRTTKRILGIENPR